MGENTEARVVLKSELINKEIEVERLIGKLGDEVGPTVVITAGVHGNEPLGVFALHKVVDRLKRDNIHVKGNFYAFTGNLGALRVGKRFLTQDLNRLWKVSLVEKLETGKVPLEEVGPDMREMVELHRAFRTILESEKGPFHFIDLHTTSSPTAPFIPVSDTLTNRTFARKFPIPSVLGIEEFLSGALLSYINEFDAVALGFEAGPHEDPVSVDIHEAMCYLTLVYSGCVDQKDIPEFDEYYSLLKRASQELQSFYEVRRRYLIADGEEFEMHNGYESFQLIKEGELLANNQHGEIRAIEDGRIFMPLYQTKGREGFFIVREVAPFWLRLSAVVRKIRLDSLLSILPGIRKHPKYSGTLIVDTKIARLLATDLFHLLGYRRKRKLEDVIYFTRREL